MDQKGIAPFVIVAIFVVVSVVAGIGIYVATHGGGNSSGNGGDGGGLPSGGMVTVSAHASSSVVTITITDEAGFDLPITDLEVRASDSTGAMITAALSPSSGTFSEGGTLTATYAYGASPQGKAITVYIIHKPSKQMIFNSSSVVVQSA